MSDRQSTISVRTRVTGDARELRRARRRPQGIAAGELSSPRGSVPVGLGPLEGVRRAAWPYKADVRDTPKP
jgi:hypothetical protein